MTKINKDTGYCDHCGEQIPTGDACAIASLPVNIASENAGGSAVVCADCYVLIITAESSLVWTFKIGVQWF